MSKGKKWIFIYTGPTCIIPYCPYILYSFIMPIVEQVIDVAHGPLVITLINLDANLCCINKKCLIVLAKLKKKQTSNIQITKLKDL